MLPLETLPPGDPSGGVVYLRIVLSPEEASCMWMSLNINVLQGRVVSTSPNTQARGPPLVGCPRLLIQFIRSYPPYRRPFSIRNLRTRHAVVTGTHYCGKKLLNIRCVLMFSTIFVLNISHFKNNLARYDHKCTKRSACKIAASRVRF